MPLVDVININKEKVGQADLPDAVFDAPVKPHLVHEVVVAQLASRRRGTASTKDRSEVAGSTRKLYRQKGTGRARAGSKRNPVWRGGGTIFGPRPRDYGYRPPKKVRRLALMAVLSSKLQDGELIVLDALPLSEVKTKLLASMLGGLDVLNAVIVIPSEDRTMELAARNLPKVKVLRTDGLNCYDLVKHEKLILLESAIGPISERLAK